MLVNGTNPGLNGQQRGGTGGLLRCARIDFARPMGSAAPAADPMGRRRSLGPAKSLASGRAVFAVCTGPTVVAGCFGDYTMHSHSAMRGYQRRPPMGRLMKWEGVHDA